MQRGKEGLANGSRVVFFCFVFFSFIFFFCLFFWSPCSISTLSKIFLFPAPTPPPQPATSDDTAKLHWIPTLLLSFLIFVRKHKRARIFDTTYFYMSYSCKNENDTKHKTYYIRGTAHVLFVYKCRG